MDVLRSSPGCSSCPHGIAVQHAKRCEASKTLSCSSMGTMRGGLREKRMCAKAEVARKKPFLLPPLQRLEGCSPIGGDGKAVALERKVNELRMRAATAWGLLAEGQPSAPALPPRGFEEAGAGVKHAEDGLLAEKMSGETLRGFFGVIPIDRGMPSKDGLEASCAIWPCRADDAQRVPLLALAARPLPMTPWRQVHRRRPADPHARAPARQGRGGGGPASGRTGPARQNLLCRGLGATGARPAAPLQCACLTIWPAVCLPVWKAAASQQCPPASPGAGWQRPADHSRGWLRARRWQPPASWPRGTCAGSSWRRRR